MKQPLYYTMQSIFVSLLVASSISIAHTSTTGTGSGVDTTTTIDTQLHYSLRTAHLPRPPLYRPGFGLAERSSNTSVLLYDTVEVGVSIVLPFGSATFLRYKPAGSAAIITSNTFIADVAGDYIVDFVSGGSKLFSNKSLCDDTPIPTLLTTALRLLGIFPMTIHVQVSFCVILSLIMTLLRLRHNSIYGISLRMLLVCLKVVAADLS